MQDDKKAQLNEVALFRYGLIADLVHLPPGQRGLSEKLAEKAERDHKIPGSLRVRVAAETVRYWLKAYRKGGFEALAPRPRSDRGTARALPKEAQDLLVSLKDENRALSVQLVIREARASGLLSPELLLAPATVHRLLSRHGLMAKGDGPTENDRRRFSFEKAGELWMSDVMHGPTVEIAGRTRRKTYLIAFIDDASRSIPHAAFALSENTLSFLPVFKQALARRGLPKRLFVDNGSAYRSQHLSLVCAKLGVTLIHARAYQPQSKGKQERWFRTVRMQLLPRLTAVDLKSLDALNRRLWGWVEGEYHQTPHRSLDGETPLERLARISDEVHLPGADLELDDLFLAEQKRKVHKDRTVSLDGVIYEVEASLVGQTVTLRYDPSRPKSPVQVWASGKKIQEAKVVDTYANCFIQRDKPTQQLAPLEASPETAPAEPPPATLPPEGLKLASLLDDDRKKGGR